MLEWHCVDREFRVSQYPQSCVDASAFPVMSPTIPRLPRSDECVKCYARKTLQLFRAGGGGSILTCRRCGEYSFRYSPPGERLTELPGGLVLNPYARGIVRWARKDHVCRSSDPRTPDRSQSAECRVLISGGEAYVSDAVGFTFALCMQCGIACYAALLVTREEALEIRMRECRGMS